MRYRANCYKLDTIEYKPVAHHDTAWVLAWGVVVGVVVGFWVWVLVVG